MSDKAIVRKIAFYAPMKSPEHPQPSGDRLIAQLLFKALQQAGFSVRLISEFRSRDADGDAQRQGCMVELGEKLATRLLKSWQREGYRPDLVFCYHNYYKAPDLIGPSIAEQLDIPYWVAEASWANKRAHGPWKTYHRALARGLKLAAGAIVLNPVDAGSLAQVLPTGAQLLHLPVFLDLQSVQTIATPPDTYAKQRPAKLVTVAMLRPGDKLHSLVLLAHALKQLKAPARLHVIGDGKARLRAQSLFQGLDTRFEGLMQPDAVRQFVSQCDLLVWPAVNEAIGMAILEAQACGTPVLVGREGGTYSVVDHGATGELTAPRDATAFAQALQRLLDQPATLNSYRKNTRLYVQTAHSLDSAASLLNKALN